MFVRYYDYVLDSGANVTATQFISDSVVALQLDSANGIDRLFGVVTPDTAIDMNYLGFCDPSVHEAMSSDLQSVQQKLPSSVWMLHERLQNVPSVVVPLALRVCFFLSCLITKRDVVAVAFQPLHNMWMYFRDASTSTSDAVGISWTSKKDRARLWWNIRNNDTTEGTLKFLIGQNYYKHEAAARQFHLDQNRQGAAG
ncbi:hypothetical protein BDR22DRAFT_890806 [Usnea florida]